MRKCMVMKWDLKSGNRVDDYEAWFHTWSIDFEMMGVDRTQYPVAIVEKMDGTVMVEHAVFIRFLEPPDESCGMVPTGKVDNSPGK